MTPQPAGHSRHTVANHEATPGTICSFGTTSGRIDSVACWHPAVAAAAPDAVTILKKSRRFTGRSVSMVACHAVERRVPARRRVLFSVAVDAPAHRERGCRSLEADQIEKVVRQTRPRLA